MEENSVRSKKQPQPPQDLRLASQPIEMQKRAINRLWERMTQLWGHRHQSAWGQSVDANGNLTDTAELWLQGLGKYTLREIADGVTQMVEKGQEWPPTLPEFMQMCKPKRLAPYHKMAALPAPAVDSAIAYAELRKIRSILNNNGKCQS
jgi:hypothetical protein|tara:strand:- start:435 stop:881 length:447 start_codon:yes stop_codon:yes gene_type:complete